MEPARQRFAARCILAAFAAVCAVWLGTLDYGRKISTDVLDLIPPSEQSPELGLVRNIAGNRQARIVLFALREPAASDASPARAAALLAAELARSPAFAEATAMNGDAGMIGLGREVFDRRFSLLLPSWLAERWREFSRTGRPASAFSPWLAERSASDLQAFLDRPESAAFSDLIPRDPLLLLPRVVDRARAIAPASAPAGVALVWARLGASPFSGREQAAASAAIDRAFAAVRSAYPGLELRWSGVNRFAAVGRSQIEREIKLLNLLSVAAVLAVACLLVRRVWKIIHLLPVILCSELGALTVSTMVFGRIHVFVFVIGSLLSGVAVDYGFYIYLQPPLRPDESYADKLGRLLKPLLASCLTTVIGFSLLLFSDLPFIRQIGLFVASGLLCALGGAMLYFAQLPRPFLESRRLALEAGRAVPPWIRIGLRAAGIAALAAALIGPWRLHWRDDVRELEIPAPELQANDQALRGLFGDTPDRSAFLTYGATVGEARRSLEDFLAYRSRLAPSAPAASLGSIFPTEEDWNALPGRLGLLGGFESDFRSALDRHGFVPAAFDPFFDAWSRIRARPPSGSYAGLYAEVGRTLAGPLAQSYDVQGSPRWFLTVADGPEGAAPPPGLHTIGVDQLQTLDRLFTRYRWSALRLSLIGLGLVIASVFLIYPFRPGLRIALIPAGSCFVVLGAMGLCGQTLDLFHLVGAFLGVCLSHNYSIFSSESSRAGQSPPTPVRLSALCAAASFGVLACSRIPVVHALGLTVALIVLTALLGIELEPLARGPRRD